MATGTGIDSQLGVAEEVTYGTYVAPTLFYEFVSEKITLDLGKIYGKNVRSFRFQRSNRVRTYVKQAKGEVTFGVATTGFGLLFKHMFGAVSTTSPGAPKPLEKVHTFTPDPNGLKGKSLSWQVGRPEALTGVVVPFSYPGGKINSWELSAKLDDILMLSLSNDFKTEDTAQVLTAASYSASPGALLTFVDGSVTVGGSTYFVKGISVKGENNLAVDRRGLGNVKREPLASGELGITGSLDCEFEGLTNHTSLRNGTTAQLVLTFSYGEIDAGQSNPFKIVVTIPLIEFTGDPPTVDGAGVVQFPLKFKGLYNGTNPLITLEYRTTDVTP
jgi:hypothetical protein